MHPDVRWKQVLVHWEYFPSQCVWFLNSTEGCWAGWAMKPHPRCGVDKKNWITKIFLLGLRLVNPVFKLKTPWIWGLENWQGSLKSQEFHKTKICAGLGYTYDWNYLKSALFYFIKRWKQNKEKPEKHPSPSSDAFSQDLALLTSSSRHVLRQMALKSRCTKPLGVCIPNLSLSDPHPFPGDSVFISIKTQNHFFFFLLCQFLKPGRVSA